jgi:DNA-binding transcriptional ArsR family regulator
VQQVLEAISNPRRREILRLVWDEERSAGDIASRFDVTWSAISQNLKVLRSAGLVAERREGTKRLYRAHPAALGSLAEVLREMWERDLDAVAEAMDRERRG